MSQSSTLRDVDADDAAAIAAIYNHYVESTTISMETDPVDAAGMAQRIQDIQHAGLPWLVLTVDDRMCGYAYASK